jgi:hypothetical protein
MEPEGSLPHSQQPAKYSHVVIEFETFYEAATKFCVCVCVWLWGGGGTELCQTSNRQELSVFGFWKNLGFKLMIRILLSGYRKLLPRW